MGGDTWIRPKRLLIVAAIFHVAVTMAIYTLGRHAVLPSNFDSNGIAISFAPDAAIDRADAATLTEILRRSSFRDWLTAPFAFHTKLYSLCFALFGTTLGMNILGAEPINLVFYLAMLILVFQLGQEAFNARAGILASVIVGLWPSLVLHSTQMLKDPLFLVGMLGFVLINVHLLSRNLSWLPATWLALLGGLVAIFVWLGRDSMDQMLVSTSLLGVTLLVVRQVREKQLRTANLFALTLLALISISVTLLLPRFTKPDNPTATTNMVIADELSSNTATENSTAQSTQTKQGPVARVSALRKRFIEMYPDSTSNVDTHIQLTRMADILRYTPRAAAIGFFAPFPNMWLASGKQVGSAGRLLSGIETLGMYAIEALAIIGLWRERRRVSVWLLVGTATIGVIALGLIVVNIGALYRLRYAFLILIIIVAAGGISDLLGRYNSRAHS